MDDVKITHISVDDYEKYTLMSDFQPVCRYGKNLTVMKNEIGCLCDVVPGSSRIENGFFVDDIVIKERIFLNDVQK